MENFFFHAKRFSLLNYDSAIYDDFGAGGTAWDNNFAILMEDGIVNFQLLQLAVLPGKRSCASTQMHIGLMRELD